MYVSINIGLSIKVTRINNDKGYTVDKRCDNLGCS